MLLDDRDIKLILPEWLLTKVIIGLPSCAS